MNANASLVWDPEALMCRLGDTFLYCAVGMNFNVITAFHLHSPLSSSSLPPFPSEDVVF